MKKSSLLFIIVGIVAVVGVAFFTSYEPVGEEIKVNNKVVRTGKSKHKKCTRRANAGEGVDVSLNYDLYYTDDNLNILRSEEKIITEDQKVLDEYEEAYKKIHDHYKELKNYDTEIERDDNSVTSLMVINYDKVDINKLQEIEQTDEENSIFEKGKAKVEKWLTLAKKFGTECEDVEEEA